MYKFQPLLEYNFQEVEETINGGINGSSDMDSCTCADILQYLKKLQEQILKLQKLQLKELKSEQYKLYWENLQYPYNNPIQPFWEQQEFVMTNPNQPHWEKNN